MTHHKSFSFIFYMFLLLNENTLQLLLFFAGIPSKESYLCISSEKLPYSQIRCSRIHYTYSDFSFTLIIRSYHLDKVHIVQLNNIYT